MPSLKTNKRRVDDEPANKRRNYGNGKEKTDPKYIQEMELTQCAN